jgi:hypothetical protein
MHDQFLGPLLALNQLCSCVMLNDRVTVNNELAIWSDAACSKALFQHFSGETQGSRSNLSQG